jgi:hypothetical protein
MQNLNTSGIFFYRLAATYLGSLGDSSHTGGGGGNFVFRRAYPPACSYEYWAMVLIEISSQLVNPICVLVQPVRRVP